MRRLNGIILSLAIAATGVSCSDSERNVILRTEPFYKRHVSDFSEADSGRVVNEVRAFAHEREMDFLMSQDGPDPGDFNAMAAGQDINFQVMHIKVVGGGLDVLAYVRGKPTRRDRQLADEFYCRVTRGCPSVTPQS
jgi:hypothetical protein